MRTTLLFASLMAVSGTALAAAPDTLLLQNGGVVRGQVIEHDPAKGTTVLLADGTKRSYEPGTVRDVRFAEDPRAAAPAAAPPATAAPAAPATAAPTATPMVTTAPIAPEPSAEITPMDFYRSGTVSLMAGNGVVAAASGGGVGGLFGNGGAQGSASVGVDVRGVLSGGILVDGRLGIVYPVDAANDAGVGFGVSAGYVIPLSGSVGLLPGVDLAVATATASGSAALLAPSAFLAVDCFLGKNAFIEPYATAGGVFSTQSGAGAAALGVGYRLGVVFDNGGGPRPASPKAPPSATPPVSASAAASDAPATAGPPVDPMAASCKRAEEYRRKAAAEPNEILRVRYEAMAKHQDERCRGR